MAATGCRSNMSFIAFDGFAPMAARVMRYGVPVSLMDLTRYSRMARSGQTFLILVVISLAAAIPARAQSGSVSGKVTGADRGGPLAGALVSLDTGGLRVAEVRTRSDGSYRITGV